MAAGALLVLLKLWALFGHGFGPFELPVSMSGWLQAGFGSFLAGALLLMAGQSRTAGAGAVFDPEQTRYDRGPWNGLLNDAVRCRWCRAVNEADARYCAQCGNPV